MFDYNPKDWAWVAEDGRVFRSDTQTMTTVEAGGVASWENENRQPTIWPRDENGEQTIAALQEVLTPYGMFADLKAYAASVRYQKEVGGAMINGQMHQTDRETQSKLTSAVVMTTVNPEATFQWKMGDGNFVTLDAAALMAHAQAVGAYVQDCFADEAVAVAGIDDGSITSTADVDALFA